MGPRGATRHDPRRVGRRTRRDGRGGGAPAGDAESAPDPPAEPDDFANPPSGSGAVIKVIGVGGGGGNSVNRMIEAGVAGVEFIAANTDLQVLRKSRAPVRIQLGRGLTKGRGCGGDPDVGRRAALEDTEAITRALRGADMIFITVGEGGGTGTGAAPIVACVAQELGALSVAVVTQPLGVEGPHRRNRASDGIRELREWVDTLISVPNDRVVAVFGNKPLGEAFRDADEVVRQAVQGISDLIQVPGVINLDFADVRAAIRSQGDAVMGIGAATGENRVEEATRAAISSPLLEDTNIEGATSIIVNVTGGNSLTLNEVQRAAEMVRDAVKSEEPRLGNGRPVEPGDNILLGTALDPSLDDDENGGAIKVTVVATGFPSRTRAGATPHDFATIVAERNAMAADRKAVTAAEETPAEEPIVFRRPSVAAAAARAKAAAPKAAPPPKPEMVAEEPPASDPGEHDSDRWGDLDTPAYLRMQKGR